MSASPRRGLAADVGIGNAAFAFGASIFFVGYALLEVPSNLALHRFGARRWMARIMITWGIVSAANAFVTGPEHLLRRTLPARHDRSRILSRA